MAASGEASQQKKAGWNAIWAIVILILLSAAMVYAVWWLGERRLASERQQASEELETRTELMIRNQAFAVGQSLATMSIGYLEEGRTAALQEAFDRLVRDVGLESITIYDLELRGVVATNRKDLNAVNSAEELVEAGMRQEPTQSRGRHYFPLMGSVRRYGTMRVEYDPENDGLSS